MKRSALQDMSGNPFGGLMRNSEQSLEDPRGGPRGVVRRSLEEARVQIKINGRLQLYQYLRIRHLLISRQ